MYARVSVFYVFGIRKAKVSLLFLDLYGNCMYNDWYIVMFPQESKYPAGKGGSP